MAKMRATAAIVLAGAIGLSASFMASAQSIMPRAPDVAGSSYILIDANTGHVIMEHNSDEALPPASLTKIMTAYIAEVEIDNGNLSLDDMAFISERAWRTQGSKTFVDVNSYVRVEDLLRGIIIQSGNDASVAIAEHIAGSEEAFADLMNQHARALGLTNSYFINSSGLDVGAETNLMSARDLATLSYEAMKNDTFKDIVRSDRHQMGATNMQKERMISTGHRIMLKTYNGEANSYYYEYITGIKSGTTDAAGYCYVGAAEKDGVELISVVLYSDRYNVWRDTRKLFEYGFSQYTHTTLTEMYMQNPLRVFTSGYDKDDVGLGELELSATPVDPTKTVEISGTYAKIEELTKNLRNLVMVQYTRELKAPITAGEVIGKMTYTTERGEAIEYNLLATRSVVARKNRPPSLSDIIAMTEADPNPFPPLTVEIALIVLSPLLITIALIFVIRLIVRGYKRHYARLPKNKNRYVK